MRLRRRPPAPAAPPDEKTYLVTIHAPGDQYHTFAMGPGDGVGVGDIRVDIHHDGSIHASPIVDKETIARDIQDELLRQARP